jgi:plastocyanin
MLRFSSLFITVVAASLVILGASVAYRASAATAGQGSQSQLAVSIADDAFKPPSLVVQAGTRVTWTNADDDPHTVTTDTSLFDSRGLARGDSFSYVFRKPGTYAYYCKVHPFMKGVVIVKGAHS